MLPAMNRHERRAKAKTQKKAGGEKQAVAPLSATDAPAVFKSAVEALNAGALKTAEEKCRALLARFPEHAETLDLLGVVRARQGDAAEAATLMARGIALAPTDARALNNFANVLTNLGRREEAVALYRRALAQRPDDAQIYNNMGSALYHLGKLDEAEGAYRRALELKSDYAEAWSNYGNVLIDKGDVAASIEVNRKAIAARADYAPAWNNLGNGLKRQGLYGAALDAYAQALKIQPLYAGALGNVAEAMKEQGRAAAAIPFYRRALEIDPADAAIHANLLFALNAVPGVSRQDLFEESRRWAARFAPVPDGVRHDNAPYPDRVLRVGYVSADFRRHSVAYFIEPVIAAHDRRNVEVVCYADVVAPDAVTRRIRAMADLWRDVRGFTDIALAELVRRDRIDILVDLGGHTMESRLRAFAYKPAPVQVAYLGYPGTTGMAQMDARIVDAWTDPEGTPDAMHTEKLVRLPNGFLCYRPSDTASAIAPPPSIKNGFVTFGSFNNLSKVTDETIVAWAAVLKAVPGSRLLLKAKALADPATRDRVVGLFGAQGIAPDRLDLMGWVLDGDPLETYNRVDIGLDTFPYNGTTTTCEALWMGVPVVSLIGATHAGRVGLSLLTRAGLADLAAPSVESYAAAAAGLAQNSARLAALRSGLRDRLASGGILDRDGFVRSLESAYRGLWRDWRKAF